MCVCCVQENLEKQTQHAQTLTEKLWLAERQLEELQVYKDTKDKKSSELNSTILRLETEVQRPRWFLSFKDVPSKKNSLVTKKWTTQVLNILTLL